MAFQGDSIYWVEVEKVVPNPYQPRKEFDERKLRELGESIRMYGVLQPLTVTRKEVQREDGTFYTEYELIAGERRLRASKLSGVSQVPVIIRDGEESEQEKLELAIIENLQREDLNAIDRALAFKQLADEFDLSHAQVAQKVGRSREYVSNSIRLLALPENILEAVKTGAVTEGHARTLLMLNDRPEEQQVVFQEAVLKKLSVRDVEKIARGIATEKIRKKTLKDTDVELMEMEKRFTESLGTRVQIHKTEFGGRVAIDYFTVDDLETILERIKIEEEAVAESNRELQKLVAHTPLTTSGSETEAVAEPSADESPAVVEMADKTAASVSSSLAETPQETEVPTSSPLAETARDTEAPISSFESFTEASSETNQEEAVADPVPTPTTAPVEPEMTPSQPAEIASAFTAPEPTAEQPSPDQTASTTEAAPVDETDLNSENSKLESEPEDSDDSDLYSINRFTV